MRHGVLLFAVSFVLLAGNPKPPDLPLIDRLDELVQLRFGNPMPGALGMSRIAIPASIGKHFTPQPRNERDFIPETAMEREVTGKLEERGVQVGIYVAGTGILTATRQSLDYRALKGPGAVTRGTPRPQWYPGLSIGAAPAGALPDWNAVYPLARRAMQGFADGRPGFESTLDSWDIAARPVLAEARCVQCHSAAKAGKPIGAVLYAFRRGKG